MIVRRAHAYAVAALSSERVPATTLRALAEVVLPSELGQTGTTRATDAFTAWMRDYREHAELTHGYGTSRIRYSGPTPATRWTSQLDALDAAAERLQFACEQFKLVHAFQRSFPGLRDSARHP